MRLRRDLRLCAAPGRRVRWSSRGPRLLGLFSYPVLRRGCPLWLLMLRPGPPPLEDQRLVLEVFLKEAVEPLWRSYPSWKPGAVKGRSRPA